MFSRWHKPKPVRPIAIESTPGTPIAVARESIELKIEKHLTIGSGMLVVNATPGVGKSYQALTAVENIADVLKEKTAWFSSRHNGYDSLERDDDWLHVTGRRDDKTSSLNGDVLENGNCPNFGYCNSLSKNGYSPAILFCSPENENKKSKSWQCNVMRQDCEYWRQWSDPIHRYMPSQFIGIGKLWSKHNHLVVLDELDAYSLTPQPVRINAEMLKQWLLEYPQYEDWIVPLVNFLDVNTENVSDESLLKVLSSFLPDTASDSFLDDIPSDFEIDLDSADDLRGLPDRNVEKFLSIVYHEIKDYRDWLKVVVSRIVAGKGYFTLYLPANFDQKMAGRLPIPRLVDYPSILLNATVETEPLEEIFNLYDYSIEVFRPHVGLHNDTTVTYDISSGNAKTTLRSRGKRRLRWIEAIKNQIAKYQSSLVIATVEGENILKAELKSEVDAGKVFLAHYGNVSGLNAYEHCQQVILAQPFNPPAAAVAGRYRSVYGGTDGEPLNLETCFRDEILSDGAKAFKVAIHTMKDERLRPIFEHWRDSEHYQSLHRVRPILFKRHLHIMFGIGIPNLQPTETIYNPAKNGRPDIYNKIRTEAREIIESQGHCSRSDLIKASFSKKTILKHFDRLRQEFCIASLTLSSARYRNGRVIEVLTGGESVKGKS